MAVTEITEPVPVLENGKVNKTALIKAGKNSVRWLNNPANNDKQQFVRIKDIDTDVLVNTKSLEHGMRHPKSVNDTFEVYPHIGKILEDSIVVNELNSRGNEKFSYITLGVAKKGNDFYFVRATINVLNENLAEAEEIEVYDKLKGIVAHKETASGLGSPLPFGNKQPSANAVDLSIKEFLDIVKDHYPEILSDDVLSHYGMERPKYEKKSDAG